MLSTNSYYVVDPLKYILTRQAHFFFICLRSSWSLSGGFNDLIIQYAGFYQHFYVTFRGTHWCCLVQEEEDQDWAHAEALRESRAVEEVVFAGSNAGGLLVRCVCNILALWFYLFVHLLITHVHCKWSYYGSVSGINHFPLEIDVGDYFILHTFCS